jgi:hypothetical protein
LFNLAPPSTTFRVSPFSRINVPFMMQWGAGAPLVALPSSPEAKVERILRPLLSDTAWKNYEQLKASRPAESRLDVALEELEKAVNAIRNQKR